MQALHDKEKLLKEALAAGDFQKAQRLLPAYTEELASFRATASSDAERQQAIGRFRDLLSLARVMRAHLSSQLSVLRHQAGYRYQLPAPERHAWQFEA